MSAEEPTAALTLDAASRAARETRALAQRAVRALPASSAARRAAQRRTVRPVDYMRYAEFAAVLRDLEIAPGSRVLDVGSPQWFSLHLADRHPDASFTYVNIVESELEPFREVAQALGLGNIEHRLGDVRDLEFPDHSFDRAISISVIEHVHPEVGGDVAALHEIGRVLAPGGELLLTLPYKTESGVVRVDGPVYERGPEKDNFFAREYDRRTFADLVEASGLALEDSWMISERVGTWSVDLYEWGPGSRARLHSAVVRSRVLLQLLGLSFDEALARRYLRVSRESDGRLVNVSARLRKEGA